MLIARPCPLPIVAVMTRLCSALLTGLLVCLFSLAHSGGDVCADELKEKAQQLLSEGNALASEGDFGLALVKFRTAHELYPSPKLLLNIGTSLRQIGRNAEAAETYDTYLAHADADPAREDELRSILDDLENLVGRLEIRVAQPGARVSLDGKILRGLSTGTSIRVDPGEHTVTAEKAGRPSAVRHVKVEAGQTLQVALSLDEAAAEESTGPDAREVIGYTLVGLGGVTVVIGAVLGGVALGTKSDADDQCQEAGEFAGYCSAEGADLLKTARLEGVAATATAIAGLAVVAGGLALALSVLADDVPVEVGIGPTGISIRGRW